MPASCHTEGGEPVHHLVELPDGAGVVMVLDWSNKLESRLQNLVCVAHDQSVKWRAELPQTGGPDCFVHTSMDGTLVRANTWSGYAIWIDPETGRALKSEFVK
jgi:hypothetical protein